MNNPTFWLASYPRSGSTYARLILKNVFGFCTPSGVTKEAPLECQLTQNLNDVDSSKRVFMKTHKCRVDDTPAIVLVRDGRDALISHVHYQRRFWGWSQPFPELLDRAIDPSDDFCTNWSAFYQNWQTKSEQNCELVRFEELVENPLDTLQQVIANLGLSDKAGQSEYAIPGFAHLHGQNSGFFRKGRSGYWQKEMTDQQHHDFWHYHGAMMQQLGYRKI